MDSIIKFGVEDAHADFVIPVAIIKLTDAKGKSISTSLATTMYIRMGGTFSTAIRAAYDDAQGIMGRPFGQDDSVLTVLKKTGLGTFTGLQAQVAKGVVGAGGLVASAGQSGRQQLEFLTRVFLSNFQQVVYRGPSFRIFTLPFVMKPTSKKEAQDMIKIIRSLKAFSAPTEGARTILSAVQALRGTAGKEQQTSELYGGSFDRVTEYTRLSNIISERQEAIQKANNGAITQDELNRDPQYAAAIAEINQLTADEQDFFAQLDATDESRLFQESPITFGYPGTCKFQLALVQNKTDAPIETVFESDLCVIESVVVDYGSSNKMTFFQDDYFPTEVSLTLNLKELVFQTTNRMAEAKKQTHKIIWVYLETIKK